MMGSNGICCKCKIASDDFNRADADDPGAAWDELGTGDADISGNALLMAATPAETVIRFQTAHPDGASAPARVKVQFMLDSLADVCGVLMSGDGTAADMAPFCQAKIQQTGSCNELYLEGPNGIESSTQRLPGLTANEWHTIEVCFEPGDTSSSPEVAHLLRAKVTLANGDIYGDQLEITSLSNHTPGAYVGLRGYAGTQFDDFYFGWMRDEDTACKAQCPNCNTPCPIEDDDFNRSDSSDLGCKWTEVSGGWSITSNELACTSAGIVLCAVHHPQDKSHQHVTARMLADALRTPRIVVNAKADGSSYHWAQLSYNDVTNVLTLSIGKDGSTLDSVTSTLSAAAFVDVTVCFINGALTASANGQTVFEDSPEVVGGIYSGLSGSSGGERFDDFSFEKHKDADNADCPDCPEADLDCDCCDPDMPAPSVLTADVPAGLINDGCDGCEEIEGEYGLTPSADQVPGECTWSYRSRLCDYDECGVACGDDLWLQIDVSLTRVNATHCKFVGTIAIEFDSGDPTCNCTGVSCFYESAEFVHNRDCRTISATLDRMGACDDLWLDPGNTIRPCTGAFPSSFAISG